MLMNRRSFIKLLGSGAIALTLPVSALNLNSLPEKFLTNKVKVIAELTQWDTQLMVGFEWKIGDNRYRHAVEMELNDLGERTLYQLSDLINEHLSKYGQKVNISDIEQEIRKIA